MVAALGGMALLYAMVVGVAAWWATAELGAVAVPFIVAVACVAVIVQYRYAPTAALRALDAERVDESEYPDLHARVARLASQADVPAPDLAVAPHATPNAFATARGRGQAVVAVTEGLLDAVEGDELDAVLAHEIAHVKHRDALVLSLVTVLVTVGAAVGRNFWWFGGGGGDAGGGGGGDGGQPWFLVFVVASLVAWAAGSLLSRVVSRQREFAADRGAAAITGNPGAMASAIETVSAGVTATPDDDLREHAELNALFFSPVEPDSHLADLLATHPAPDRRVERLAEMTGEFERGP